MQRSLALYSGVELKDRSEALHWYQERDAVRFWLRLLRAKLDDQGDRAVVDQA